MTNYVHNEWLIEGPAEALDAFEALALTPAPPPPSGLSRFWRKSVATVRTLDLQRLRPIAQQLDGHALRQAQVAAWGTERIEAARYLRSAPGRAELEFYSTWSHPAEALPTLANKLPDSLLLRGTYLEEGNAYAGRFTVRGGTVDDVEEALVDGFEMIFSGPWREEG